MTGYKVPPDATKFKKGDPRINRLGRPKNMPELREMVQRILHEKLVDKVNGVAMTRIELIARDMAMSKDPRKVQSLLEIAFGKIPQAVDVSLSDKVVVEIVRETLTDTPEKVAPEATSD